MHEEVRQTSFVAMNYSSSSITLDSIRTSVVTSGDLLVDGKDDDEVLQSTQGNNFEELDGRFSFSDGRRLSGRGASSQGSMLQ